MVTSLGGLPQRVVDLFAHPGGLATEPMAAVLNFFNRRANGLVADALELRPGKVVLEVGFGGGAAIPTTAARIQGDGGCLYGVDLSSDMVARSRRVFTDVITSGVFIPSCGDVSALPLRTESVDAAYAIHSHLYWPDPLAGVREMIRILRPGGALLLAMDAVTGLRLVQAFGPRYDPAGPERLRGILGQAGMTSVRTRALTRGVVAVLGTKPA